MPPRRELPGFYFDEAKNRYFPLSSRPKEPSVPVPTLTASAGSNSGGKRRRLDLRSSSVASSSSSSERRRSLGEESHVRTWHAIRDFQDTGSSRQRLRATRSVDLRRLCLGMFSCVTAFYSGRCIDHRWRRLLLVNRILSTQSHKVLSQHTE